MVASKVQKPKNGKSPISKKKATKAGKPLQRFQLPVGPGWAARVARGLARWRNKHNMTIPQAAERCELNQTNWYRIERGQHSATTAIHIDDFCSVIDMDVIDLIKLGTPPWGEDDARSQPEEE